MTAPGATVEPAAAAVETDQAAVDVSTLLRVGTRGAWGLYGVFAVSLITFATLSFENVKDPLVSLLALFAVLAAAALLVLAKPDPFPIAWTAAVLTSGTVATSLVAWNVIDNDGPGREAWYIYGFTWMLFFLAMRGRPGAAWLGLALMVGTQALWGLVTDHDVVAQLLRFETSGAIVVVAVLFTRALRRSSRTINQLLHQSVDIARSTATANAAGAVRRARLAELRSIALPMLNRIVSNAGAPGTEQERCEYAATEAAVRDTVRCRTLSVPQVAQAARGARLRGAEVTLIDDRGEDFPTQEAFDRLVQRVVWVLESANGGKVTVRLTPPGRAVAASIVVTDGEDGARYDLDEQGRAVDRADA